MDTLFWTNIKANNNHIKFEGSKTLRKGFTSSLRINDKWLYCCNYAANKYLYNAKKGELLVSEYDYWRWTDYNNLKHISYDTFKKKNRNKISNKNALLGKLVAYKDAHPEIKFKFGYSDTDIMGSEENLIAFINTFPEILPNLRLVIIPSSDKSEKLLSDGYILTKTEPTMPFRAKTQSGWIKKSSLEKVVRQVELSPDRYAVSGWFKNRAAGYIKNWYTNNNWTKADTDQIHMSSSNIYFKNEHDIALFSLIDPSLTKKIEKVSIDPGIAEIVKLNRIRRKHVTKSKKLV